MTNPIPTPDASVADILRRAARVAAELRREARELRARWLVGTHGALEVQHDLCRATAGDLEAAVASSNVRLAGVALVHPVAVAALDRLEAPAAAKATSIPMARRAAGSHRAATVQPVARRYGPLPCTVERHRADRGQTFRI